MCLKRHAVYCVARKHVQHRAQRHAYEHSDDAHGVAADGNGDEDPYARQTDAFADDLGVDEIALKLLEHDDEHDEPQRLNGLDEQDEKRADRGSDKRAEHGDKRREADEHGYCRCVGH